MKKNYEKHEIQEAMTHLLNAHEVMQDVELMKVVKEKMNGMHKIKSIQDLRDVANNPKEEKDESVESESTLGKDMDSDITPDDKAEKESKLDRVKNSKNPTVVGRTYK